MKLTPEQTVEFFLNIHQPVRIDNAKEILDYLLPLQDLWDSFRNEVYAQIILHMGEAYKLAGDIPAAISFLTEHIEKYSSKWKYDYPLKSTMFHHLGIYHAESNHEEEAWEAFKKHVFYLLIDNQRYSNFEFYSFRSCSPHALEDLKNNTLTLSSPTQFNDPLDCLIFPWIDTRKKALTDARQNMAAELLAKAYSYIKVRCFVRNTPLPTEAADDPLMRSSVQEQYNLLMWAHYAYNHTGYCVKYNFPENFVYEDIPNSTLSRLGNVDYVGKISLTDELTLNDAFFKKSADWSYESEVRLLHYDPYFEGDFKSLTLPPNCVKEIYFGLKCTDENKAKIRKVLEGHAVHFYQIVTQSNDLYSLASKPV